MVAPTSPTLAPPSPVEATYIGARLSFVIPRIPDFVRRAVPQLGAIERVQRLAGLETKKNPSHTRSWSSDMAGSGSVTPPPSYSETLAPLLIPMKFARRQPTKPVEAPTPTIAIPATPTQENIQWKFATQGLSLLSLAATESTAPVNNTGATTTEQTVKPDTPFARQLFIHALTYLFRALPTNLTPEETSSLSAALPASLLPLPTFSLADPDLLLNPEDDNEYLDDDDDEEGLTPLSQRPSTDPAATAKGSIIYRLTSLATVQFFVLLTFLLPWIQYLVARAMELNKQHHLSERLLRSALGTADRVGRGAWDLSSSAATALQGGRVASLLEGALQWWLTGVSGGVWEGVGEGLAILGQREERGLITTIISILAECRRPAAVNSRRAAAAAAAAADASACYAAASSNDTMGTGAIRARPKASRQRPAVGQHHHHQQQQQQATTTATPGRCLR